MKGTSRTAENARSRAAKKARPRNGESSTSALYRGFADALSRAKSAGGGFGNTVGDAGEGVAEMSPQVSASQPANDEASGRD